MIRRRMMFNNADNVGLVFRSYLESTGTQYIDTGFKPSTNDTEFYYEGYWTAKNSSFMGAYGYKSGSYMAMCLGINYTNNNFWPSFRYGIYAESTWTNSGLEFSTTKQFHAYIKAKSVVKLGYGGTTYQNTGISSWAWRPQEFQSTFILFARSNYANNGNIIINDYCKFKLERAYIREGGVYVHDFRPATLDGVRGLWDIVTETFFTNSGTGTFKVGPKINS